MKLEDEIKQTKFRSIYQKAALNLLFTSGWFLNKQKEFFGKFDITGQQYNVLRILRGQYPGAISTSEIKSRMLDKNSDTSRIVDRLNVKQLVTKEICSGDKRLVDVTISEKGLKLLDQIEPHNDQLDGFFENITNAEADSLNNILDKLRN